jgi:phage FluMu gp28-like protein
MAEKDFDYIARLEKSIQKKYGREAIINPKSNWDDEKEQQYLEQLKEYSKKQQDIKEESERVEKDGFFLPKNLINRKSKRKCPVCETYSFDKRDDLYVNKFECCWMCYIQWVEGREERWKKGWRPNVKKE